MSIDLNAFNKFFIDYQQRFVNEWEKTSNSIK